MSLENPRSLEFFNSSSSKVKWPKLHLEILCTGVSRQPVRIPSHIALVDGEDGSQVETMSYGAPYAPSLHHYAPMTVQEVAEHSLRPCRKCAMEVVLDAAHVDGGTPSIPVTFSGQFVPEEIGIPVYEWEEVSASGSARLRRIAERMNLEVGESSCGPVAYGLVSPLGFSVLARNLRTYRLTGDIGERLVRGDARSNFGVEAYWMFRNSRPPELYTSEAIDVERLASALAH